MRRIIDTKVLTFVIIGLIAFPKWADTTHKYVLLGFNQLLLGLTQLKDGLVQWQDEHRDEILDMLMRTGEYIIKTDLSWVIAHPVLTLIILIVAKFVITLAKRYIDPIVVAWVKIQIAKIEGKMLPKNNKPYVITNLTAQQPKAPLALKNSQD
ncbi:hypothetical protein [Shimazuella kribbensis]|uniref:hypothetical protein n=1 Tax=Shimazuella kribbensis TaxID=139808 RepID=UPI0012EC8CA7|nr:hypothetical protein [Shimazuella kribbensis]